MSDARIEAGRPAGNRAPDSYGRGLLRWFAPLLERRCVACAVPVAWRETANASSDAPVATSDRPKRTATPGFGDSLALPLCRGCAEQLRPRTGGYCPRCGNLLPREDLSPTTCGQCLQRDPPWTTFTFHGPYQGFLRDLVLRCKVGGQLALAGMLGGLLAARLVGSGPYDAVIPLPLHPRRLRARGFNQSLELARPVGKAVAASIRDNLLVRQQDTPSQAGLSLTARRTNVRGIFSASGPLDGMRLLLVDDVATTCATLEQATMALRKAGAVTVDVAVVARTPERADGISH